MLPFGEDTTPRRNINLGGTTSQSSHTALLDRARALRNARREEKRREEAVVKIQQWLRSVGLVDALHKDLRVQFDLGLEHISGPEDQRYVHWTRLLLLCRPDDTRLSRWSKQILGHSDAILLGLFHGPYKERWLSLMRQMSLLLLRRISEDPNSEAGQLYLQLTSRLLCSVTISRPSDGTSPPNPEVIGNITTYLLRRGLFKYLGLAVGQLPPTMKAMSQGSTYFSRILASIFPNITAAKRDPAASQSDYLLGLLHFFEYILSTPLLPNRIPLKELPQLVTRLPWDELPAIASFAEQETWIPPSLNVLISQTSPSVRPHILANVLAFLTPRYNKLSSGTLALYLELYSELLDSLEPGVLEPAKFRQDSTSIVKQAVVENHISDDDDDMDVDVPRQEEQTRAQPSPSTPSLDSRTVTRLSSLYSQSSLSSLLAVSSRSTESRVQFFKFILSLIGGYPSKQDRIWTSITVSPGGGSGFIRECWRTYVRSSPLGKVEDDGAVKALMDPAQAKLWPPLLFLASLYSHSLLTMGDDEFFSLSSSAVAPRNPLTLDDLIIFSRQLLHITFPLYWYDDQARFKETGPLGIKMTWEKVREIVSSCLKAIHARDSRRRFTPPDHWLITSQLNMHSFVEAAVLEERTLANDDSADSVPVGRRRNGLSPRQLAQISPRLGILNNIPFAIPFEVRVEIFRHFVNNDYQRTFQNEASQPTMFDNPFNRPRRKKATVRRGKVAEDGFDQLSGLGSELKGPVEIQFIDQFGQEEAGIDGGGVFKEFLTSLSREVFDTNRGLWLTTQQQELYPNPHSYATEPHQLNWYRFIGRILGKALYEGILVDVAFASFFLAKWLAKQSYLDDLASLDPELYNGLIFLKHYDKNFEDLSLNFTISEEDLGVSRTVNLIPNGDQISVTKENRLQYIYLVSHYRLSKQIKKQSDAFFEGLSDIINPRWLRMFNQQEVQILVGGINAPIDIDDLQQNCNYGGLYDENHDTIRLFWKVVRSFDQEQRRGLVRFVTSCSRPPLLGFKELYPKFSIRDSSSDEQRLPTSSTCVNLLKLPRYQTERTMREKLLQAIYSGAGFDLS
ncbi:hypothetical protein M422DRAFT_25280 [Sphaerobolus stellatus SS14]|nr:hypothetical protein M422DRAFT_25280 [Sphaerobolus stellatus SS14]